MADGLLVTSSFLPGRGGIESYLAELCRQLRPRLAVLAPPQRDGRPLPSNVGYPTIPGPGNMLVPGPRARRAITDQAAQHATDRILFGTPWPLALLGPSLSAAGLRYAVIVHGAELLVPAAIPILRRRLARALAGADLLLPVSDFTAAKLRELLSGGGLNLPPIERMRARVDLARFNPDIDTTLLRERLSLGHDDRVILCFGRLVKRKGIDRLIDTLPKIARDEERVVLVIGGTGPEEARLRRRARRSSVRVAFAGRVPEKEAPALYALADVFVLPVGDRWFGLDVEGLGVVLLEAAASGVPCVTGRSGGTTEAVVDGVTGFVLDAHNKAELVERIASLLRDRALAARLGAAGRQHVRENFSSDGPPPALLRWLS